MAYTYTNIAATTAAVTNRFVTSTNMKVGTYTVANPSPVWQGGCLVTITHTTVATGTDTLGTITVVGTDINGAAQSEVMTPVADSTATSTKVFRTVTTVTGAGWVIAGGNDTLVVGCAAGSFCIGSQGTLHGIVLNNSVGATIVLSDSQRTIATIPASQAAGTLYLYDVDVSGYLKVATTSTNDVTVMHTSTQPSSYAL
jgi:hypothetical protein